MFSVSLSATTFSLPEIFKASSELGASATTFSLSEILKASSELGASAKITSLGAYAARITAAVVNDNTVLFFIIIPSFFILNPIDRKL